MAGGKAYVFYLMGPSGSGKDSLLSAVRPKLKDVPVVCIHRYITRKARDGEDHVPLSVDEFHFRQRSGLFAMSWQANGYQYAVGIELQQMLDRGVSVVMNGSRAFFREACALFPGQIVPVLVTVPEATLVRRLLARSRETGTEIDARMARNREWLQVFDRQRLEQACETMIEIDNSGDIETVAETLFQSMLEHLGQPGDSAMAENPLKIIRSLYESWGHKNYGERISQLSHALQAAELARGSGLSEEMILAAYLHDIGHLLVLDRHPEYASDGRFSHEKTGAAFLQELGFNRSVTEPVAAHVDAKRYLCCIDQGYFDSLSDASRHSLEFQGGRMSQEEAEQFACRSDLEAVLQLRRFDEQAKDTEFHQGESEWVYRLMNRHLEKPREMS
ncbi:MAG: phosphonate metabolism protein/1,5-bisphosphokinase (PRPP-forming) PhnN [Endozoicomonas sp.]